MGIETGIMSRDSACNVKKRAMNKHYVNAGLQADGQLRAMAAVGKENKNKKTLRAQ